MFEFELTDEERKELERLDLEERNKIFSRQLEYYRRNREREMERMREYYQSNPGRWTQYYHDHREKIDKRSAERKKNDPDFNQIAKLRDNLRISMSRTEPGHRGRVTPKILAGIFREEIAGRIRNYLDKNKMKKKILCIVGESGTGKTLASLHLKFKLGANVICSYTTRPPRDTEVEGRDHHFIDIVPPEEELLAFAKFGKYKYYAMKSQVYGPCTVYVIDETGVRDLMERHADEYEIYSVYIKRDEVLRLDRGVSKSRIERDKQRETFDLSFYNYIIENNGTKKELFYNIERIYNEIVEK